MTSRLLTTVSRDVRERFTIIGHRRHAVFGATAAVARTPTAASADAAARALRYRRLRTGP